MMEVVSNETWYCPICNNGLREELEFDELDKLRTQFKKVASDMRLFTVVKKCTNCATGWEFNLGKMSVTSIEEKKS
jgi:hypothetical protein